MLSFLRFKFAYLKEKIGMEKKKRLQNKTMEVKPTLTVKITLNVQLMAIKIKTTFILNVLSEYWIIFVCRGVFVKIKNKVNFIKTCFSLKNESTHAYICINIWCHKCVVYGATHLHSYTVTRKVNTEKSTLSK